MSAGCRVIVFAKAPLPGYAKTRLAGTLGPAAAAQLAQRLLEAMLEQAVASRVGPVELCAAPDTGHPVLTRLASEHGIALSSQGDGDLGARMQRALTRALRTASCALLVGTDAPALDAAYLRAAAQALVEHDAVFGPALDGGYTLVGLRREAAHLFERMPWSTPEVMRETRARAAALGLRWAELAPLADIDEPADLVHLPPGWLPAPSPRG